MSISFNQIPIDVRVPGQYIEIDNSRAYYGLPVIHNKILVIGQRLSTGTVSELVPQRITGATQGDGYFGRGSMLAAMLRTLKANNAYTECWAVAVDDLAAGVKATKTITFGGTVTGSGTLSIMIGGTRVRIAVASGTATTAVATAFAAAVNADTSLPGTATAAESVATFTANHKGECGNDIDIRANYYMGETLPKGLTVTIADGVSGTGNPDVTDVIAAIGDEQYETFVVPWTDSANLTVLETELTRRWNGMVMKRGLAFAAVAGSHSDASTLGDSRNSELLSIMGCQGSPNPPWQVAAAAAALDAYESDPARPRQTLIMSTILPPKEEDRYTLDEFNIHLHDGISTYEVDAGGYCRIQRLITTYKVNAYNVEDISYLDVETMRTAAYLSHSFRYMISSKHPRDKLANDGTEFDRGQAIVTPSDIRAEGIALFVDWERAGLVEDREQFKKDFIVERDQYDPNRVNAIIPPNVVNQFRVFAAQLQFRL